MKVINSAQITEEVKRLCIEGNLFLGKDVVDSFKQNLENEESDLGKDVLNILIENAKIACERSSNMPRYRYGSVFCQSWSRCKS